MMSTSVLTKDLDYIETAIARDVGNLFLKKPFFSTKIVTMLCHYFIFPSAKSCIFAWVFVCPLKVLCIYICINFYKKSHFVYLLMLI